MALQAADFDLEVVFNLKNAVPNFIFNDKNDYIGSQDLLIYGLFKVTSPSGQVIYITPPDTPDIVQGTYTFDALSVPTNIEGQIVEGEYCFEYTVKTLNSTDLFYIKKLFTYDFCSPKVVIETTLDCFIARLQSRDRTEYTVNGVAPDILRVHEFHYPTILGRAPLSSNSRLHEIKHPNLFEGTHTSKITSILTYDFGKQIKICTDIEGQKDTIVKCDLNLCKIYCCVRSLKCRVDRLKNDNRKSYEIERRILVEVIGLMVLFEQASRCGKSADADEYLAQILKSADCESGCKCGGCGNEDEAQQVSPFISAVSNAGTNQWLSGSGVPSNILGADTDFYIDTAAGDIHEKIGGTWVFLLNVKGKDGKDGESTQWLTGIGIPDDTVGNDNDLFLDLKDGSIYQKIAGSWGIKPLTNIKGPQGATGATGAKGNTGSQGPKGADFPKDSIVMYVGSSANFNATGLGIVGDLIGWAICNGNNGTKNLKGRFLVGRDPINDNYNIVGKLGGTERVTLSLNEIPSHNHNVSLNTNTTGVSTANAGDHTHRSLGTERWDEGSGSGSDIGPHYSNGSRYTVVEASGAHTHTVTDPGHGHSVNQSSRGGTQSHENRPPYFTTDFIQRVV